MIIQCSPNGRSVLADKRRGREYSGQPVGVWLWPDWRNAASVIHIQEFSEAEFLSNYYIWIMHYPNDGVQLGSRVINWRNPTHRFHFTGFKLHMLRVADNGRWACPMTDGTLAVGWLDADDPLWAQEAFTVPIEGEIKGLMLRNRGSILIVEVTPPGSNQPLVKSFRLTDMQAIEVGSVQSYLYLDGSTLADDSFVVVMPPAQNAVCKMITVALMAP